MSEVPRPLASPLGDRNLERLFMSAPLVAFDLDGTLVPIVRDYEKVSLGTETKKLLRDLSKEVPTAIVSGRARKDLGKILGLRSVFTIGNHGLEGLTAVKEKRFVRVWKRMLQETLRDYPGAQLEDKGMTLTVHYRKCKRKAALRKAVMEVVSCFPTPARIIVGKDVFNLLPPGEGNKGSALLALMKKVRARGAFYAGDDVTDEDVFKLRRRGIVTVRVGFNPHSHAQFFVKSQSEVLTLLKRLLRLAQSRHIKCKS